MTLSHHPAARLRRAGFALALSASALTFAAPAEASPLYKSISYSTFPADYWYDGGQPAPNPGRLPTGSYDGYVSQDPTEAEFAAPGYVEPAEGICGTYNSNYDKNGVFVTPAIKRPSFSCGNLEQLRGGAALKTEDDSGTSIPISLVPGDLLRVYRSDTKATVFDTTVTAAPAVISSVIGSPDATIGRTAEGTEVTATLERRVARAVLRHGVTPGVYTWRAKPTGSDTSDFVGTCYYFDYGLYKSVAVADVAPAPPAIPAPAGQTYYLDRDAECRTARTGVPGAPYEAVGHGRLTSATATAYGVNFGTPIQAGDLITYREVRQTTAGDVTTTLTVTTTVPVGVVPPAPPVDVAAPVIKKNDLGAPSTTLKSFLKSGLFSFITLDEPGTVTQQLLLPVAKDKKGSKSAFAPKKKKKKAPKAPIVVGTGTATSTAPGETVKVSIFSTKEGRKALKAIKGSKPVKLTLVTTVKDTLGNTVTSQVPYKLSGK